MHATQGPLSSVSLNILLYKRRCSANHRRPICNAKHKSTVCEYQPTPQTLTRTRTDSVPVHTRTHTQTISLVLLSLSRQTLFPRFLPPFPLSPLPSSARRFTHPLVHSVQCPRSVPLQSARSCPAGHALQKKQPPASRPPHAPRYCPAGRAPQATQLPALSPPQPSRYSPVSHGPHGL